MILFLGTTTTEAKELITGKNEGNEPLFLTTDLEVAEKFGGEVVVFEFEDEPQSTIVYGEYEYSFTSQSELRSLWHNLYDIYIL